MNEQIVDRKVEELKSIIGEDLDSLESEVLSEGLKLSDAIRLGSKVTEKECGWGNRETACALSAAVIAARAHGFV